MAWPGSLDANEQALVIHFVDQLIRPSMGEQGRVSNHLEALNDDYNAQISALLAALTGTDEIPNQSGLGGTATLTKDEVITLVSYAQGILTNYNTSGHRQNMGKAAGALNMIG